VTVRATRTSRTSTRPTRSSDRPRRRQTHPEVRAPAASSRRRRSAAARAESRNRSLYPEPNVVPRVTNACVRCRHEGAPGAPRRRRARLPARRPRARPRREPPALGASPPRRAGFPRGFRARHLRPPRRPHERFRVRRVPRRGRHQARGGGLEAPRPGRATHGHGGLRAFGARGGPRAERDAPASRRRGGFVFRASARSRSRRRAVGVARQGGSARPRVRADATAGAQERAE